MRTDEHIDWARQQAHQHEERWDHRHTPGDYWRSWSWLDRFMALAGGVSLALGGWLVVVIGIALGGGTQ